MKHKFDMKPPNLMCLFHVQIAPPVQEESTPLYIKEEWGFKCPTASSENILAEPDMPRKVSRAFEQEDEVEQVARPVSMIQVERAHTFTVGEETRERPVSMIQVKRAQTFNAGEHPGEIHLVGSAPSTLEPGVHPPSKEKPPPPKRSVTLGTYKPHRPELPLPFRRTKTMQPATATEKPPVPPRPRPYSGEFFIAEFPSKVPPPRPKPPTVPGQPPSAG
jgi:hypothetical protein